MSSLLALFWPSSAPVAAATAAVEPAVSECTPSCVDSPDEFIMIDTPVVSDTTAVAASKSAGHHARSDSWHVEEPVAIAAEDGKTTRSCRPYGHAHKPPALIPTAVAAELNSAASAGKRSFAAVLHATPTGASSSTSTPRVVAYAQDANLGVAEQLLAKIESLEAALDSGASAALFFPSDPSDDSIESILDSVNYASPQLRPSTRLTHDSARRLYDAPTSWTLEVDEPNSKRAKHASSGSLVLCHGKSTKGNKGPSHKQARVSTKAYTRERSDKMGL